SSDGAFAFFTKAGTLYRYGAVAGTATPIATEVTGTLGASADGSCVYYLAASGLYLWKAGVTTKVAEGADAANTPPSSGSARISADGAYLTFLSTAALPTTTPVSTYNNLDQKTGLPDSQVYLYEANAAQLRCVTCRANGTRPIGPSSIPGANPNGAAPGSTRSYKPRVLSSDGHHVVFESKDAIAPTDTNNEPDVYQWEAQDQDDCTRSIDCIDLISSGRAEEGARFVDASASGADVFFT